MLKTIGSLDAFDEGSAELEDVPRDVWRGRASLDFCWVTDGAEEQGGLIQTTVVRMQDE